MPPAWTIRSLLGWMVQDFRAAGIVTARLDAEILVAHALACDRVRLYMDLDRPLAADELARVRALVVRRRKREPVAYIVGQREFFRRPFVVGPSVLVPRPETETLIERALELLSADRSLRALDLCTGSGAIAVTLAAERPNLHVHATDVSAEALSIAQANALALGVADRVELFRGDLFSALSSGVTYDLIVANPPYVSETEAASLAPELAHEPALALFAGGEGFDVIARLCDEVKAWLAPGATFLMEVGAGQAERASERLRAAGLTGVRAHRDLGGVERVVEAVRG